MVEFGIEGFPIEKLPSAEELKEYRISEERFRVACYESIRELPNTEYELFMKVYIRHYNKISMLQSTQIQEQHQLRNVSKVEWIPKEYVFYVEYNRTKKLDGARYRYDPYDFTWSKLLDNP